MVSEICKPDPLNLNFGATSLDQSTYMLMGQRFVELYKYLAQHRAQVVELIITEASVVPEIVLNIAAVQGFWCQLESDFLGVFLNLQFQHPSEPA